MEEEEVLDSSFGTIPPCHIGNILPSGAVQEVRGDFLPNGQWVPQEDVYHVLLPFNEKGTMIRRIIVPELAYNVNGKEVCNLILEKGLNNEIGSMEIEAAEIVEILVKIGAATVDNFTLTIKPEYQMVFTQENSSKQVDITNITDFHEEDEKEEKQNE